MWPILTELCQSSHLQLPPHAYTTSQRWIVRVSLLFAWLFMIVLNIASNTAHFNHVTIQDVSDEYPTRSGPAGYAFSIWGVIFAGTGVFMIYHFVARAQTDALAPSAVVAYVLNGFACGLWPVFFSYRLVIVSLIDICIVLATTAYLYMTFFPRGISAFPEISLAYWCRGCVWCIYIGWISVATLVNFHYVLVYYGVGESSVVQDGVSVVLLVVALLSAVAFALTHDDIVAVLVFVWAFIAIAVEQHEHRTVFIAALSAAGIGLLLDATIVIAYLVHRNKHGSQRAPI